MLGLIYAYLVQHKMHELTETTYRASALRNASLIESLTALETIKTQGAEGVVQNKWELTTVFLARTNAQLRLLSASATNGAMSITQLVNVVLIIAGVYLIQDRQLSMGGLIAVTILGDAGDTAKLKDVAGGVWNHSGTSSAGGHDFDVYSNTQDAGIRRLIEHLITQQIE